MNRVFWPLAAAFVMIVVAGCGDSLNLKSASGTVTYNGNPVADASVMFIPESGPPGSGTTDASGKFSISTGGKPGATAGKNVVVITKMTETEETATTMSPEDMRAMQMGGKAPKAQSEIPIKYSDMQNSGLTADVGSQDTFDFELKD